MMWILISTIAFILGVILYNKLEPDLPEWARIGVPTPTLTASLVSQDQKVTSSEEQFYARTAHRWSFRASGEFLELSRDSITTLDYKGHKVDSPVLYITCQNNANLFIFIDTKLATQVDQQEKAEIQYITKKQGITDKWQKANGNNLYANNTQQLIRQMADSDSLVITVPYKELAPQTVTFTLSNLKQDLNKFPASCFK